MASSDCPASESVVLDSDSVDAKLHLSQGQKSLTTGDAASTIESLKEACSVLERQFGEGATEVADAYLLYGQALLLKSSAAGSSSSETKEVAAATAPSGDALAAGDRAEEAKDNSVGASTLAEAGDMASGDAVLSLQLAEKVLGYAKDAFSAVEEQQAKIKHRDALLGLGKSCLQRKNYDQCASYLEKSLDVQKTLALGNTKTLVETYYFLGVCYSALKRSADSVTELNLGMAVANDILTTEVAVNGTEGEAATEKREELSAVKGLLQNIVTKIESIRGELHIADADSTAEPAVVEPQPAQEQVAAAEPSVQTADLGDTGCTEIAVGLTADEVVMPPTHSLEPATETECAAAQGSTDSTVPSDVAAADVHSDNAVASVIPVDDVVALDVPADNVAALNVPADSIAVADVPIDTMAAADGSAVVSNITNMLWKRPLEEESQELSKKAKHDVETSENGENNGDVAVAINNADGSHEDA